MVDWLMTAILEIFQFRTTKKHCAAQCRVRLVCAAGIRRLQENRAFQDGSGWAIAAKMVD
jgi:hypothetical protein